MLNTLLKSKWYKVRLNNHNKTFTVTKQSFNKKSDGESTIKSKQYAIMNLKALHNLEVNGWTEYVKTPLLTETNPADTTDLELRRKAFQAKAQRMSGRINGFITDANSDHGEEPFNYDRAWKRHNKRAEKRIELLKAEFEKESEI